MLVENERNEELREHQRIAILHVEEIQSTLQKKILSLESAQIELKKKNEFLSQSILQLQKSNKEENEQKNENQTKVISEWKLENRLSLMKEYLKQNEEKEETTNSDFMPKNVKKQSYPVSIFVNPNIAKAFSCIVCQNIPENCYSNEDDGKVYCEQCAHLKQQDNESQGNGAGKLLSNKGIQNMIQNMKVCCLNNLQQSKQTLDCGEGGNGSVEEEVEGDGKTERYQTKSYVCKCPWVGSLKNWSEHNVHSCSLFTVECPFVGYGCLVKPLRREELKNHLEENKTEHWQLKMESVIKVLQVSFYELKRKNLEKDKKIHEMGKQFEILEQKAVQERIELLSNENSAVSRRPKTAVGYSRRVSRYFPPTCKLVSENTSANQKKIKLFQIYDKFFEIQPISVENNKGLQISNIYDNEFGIAIKKLGVNIGSKLIKCEHKKLPETKIFSMLKNQMIAHCKTCGDKGYNVTFVISVDDKIESLNENGDEIKSEEISLAEYPTIEPTVWESDETECS